MLKQIQTSITSRSKYFLLDIHSRYFLPCDNAFHYYYHLLLIWINLVCYDIYIVTAEDNYHCGNFQVLISLYIYVISFTSAYQSI